MKKNFQFEPDFTKKKFEIVITVYENTQQIEVTSLLKDYEPLYQEVVGALEIQKAMLLYDQSAYNRKLNAKRKKK